MARRGTAPTGTMADVCDVPALASLALGHAMTDLCICDVQDVISLLALAAVLVFAAVILAPLFRR